MVSEGVIGGRECKGKFISARDYDNCPHYGLLQAYIEAVSFGLAKTKTMAYYWAARFYNSGPSVLEYSKDPNHPDLAETDTGGVESGRAFYISGLANILVGRHLSGACS